MNFFNFGWPFKRLVVGVLFLSRFFFVGGQESTLAPSDNTQTYLTARYHTGFVIPHHTSMGYLIEDYAKGFDVSLGRSMFGKDNWEKYVNYPEIGLGLFYGMLGNKDIYGNAIAIYPYVDFNIIRTTRFTAHYKVGIGLGYATKSFDIVTNSYNAILGSHFNAYFNFGLLMDYRFIDRLSLSTALSVNHLSNGGTKKPNNGINTVSIGIGTKYHFNTNMAPSYHKIEPPNLNKRELQFVAFAGRSQGMNYTPNFYWSWGASASHLWLNTVKRSLGVGFDVMYFGASPYMYEQEVEKYDYDFSDSFYGGPFLDYQKNLGKTIVFVSLGYYLFKGIEPPQPIYTRLGLRYALTPTLLAHFGLKASFFSAEYLEFGFGYRFSMSKK